MIEMRIVSVGMLEEQGGNVVLLKEAGGDRMLAIGVGAMEASAIAMEIEGIQPPRPMTHDLLVDVIERLQGEVIRVAIHDLRQETFIGQIEVDSEHGVMEIDARPSDGMAVAVRTGASIYASDSVLESASISKDMLRENNEGGR